MIQGTEIRQQLRNKTLENTLVDAIKTVGNRIFPDDLAIIDMIALQQIVDAWRSTHAQTYGNVLPNTGLISEGISDGGGIAPVDNQVMDIVAIDMANAGGAPLEVTISIGDVAVIMTAIPPNGGVTSSELGSIFPLTLSKGLSLKFTVNTGTESDFSARVAHQSKCL
jgi:hypothetical protein